MNRQRLRGIFLLFIITIFYVVVVATEMYNPITYLVLLVLMGLSVMRMNDRSLVSANTLFVIFFTYAVGFGPVILMARGISYKYDFYKIIMGGLLAFCWGSAIVKPKSKIKAKDDKAKIRLNLSRLTVIRMIFFISIITSLYYLVSNRAYLLGGNIAADRISAQSGNGMILYISQLSIVAVPMLYDLYKKTKSEGKAVLSKYELIAETFLATVTLLFSGFRGPVMTMYICLAVLFIRKNHVQNRKVILLGVIAVVVVEVMGMMRTSISGGDLITRNVFGSLLTTLIVGCINLNYIFTAFPDRLPFQYGHTYLINLIMLLPGPDPDFTLWLKDALNLTFSGGGVTPSILGEFYINFRTVGIYIGMFLYGMLGVYVWRYFKKHSETFLGVFYVWQFAHSASGGIANVMITVMLYTLVYWTVMMFPIHVRGLKYAGRQRYK